MFRTHLAASAAILALAGCTSTPAPAGGGGGGPSGYGTGESYFPFIEGARWVYDVSVSDTPVGQLQEDQALVGNGATAKSAHVRFTGHLPWGHPTGLAQTELTFRQNGDKVTSTDAEGNEIQLLALPLADGTSWQTTGLAMKVDGTEDVTVPAGSYPGALRITGANGVKAWLAKGTGVVKLQLGERDGVGPVTVQLSSFTP
jgi:hypothetical protein